MATRKHIPIVGGLFTHVERAAKAAAKKTALDQLCAIVDWEHFRGLLNANLDYKVDPDAPITGRPPHDIVLMLKILVLQRIYDLSDDECELQIYDRRSFQRFLGLEHEGRIPEAKTLWKFRERLGENGVKALFEAFDDCMLQHGLMVQKSKIIDASIVQVAQRRSRQSPAQSSPQQEGQLDREATYTSKHGKTYFGYKNHVKVSAKEKLIEDYHVTPANEHDSQALGQLVDERDAGNTLYGDSAYRSEPTEQSLAQLGIASRIHYRAYRNRPLSKAQQKSNRSRTRVRSRVEHVFAQLNYRFKAHRLRQKSRPRIGMQIGPGNLVYNFFRFGFLGKTMLGAA
jgi:IS5 family transposase